MARNGRIVLSGCYFRLRAQTSSRKDQFRNSIVLLEQLDEVGLFGKEGIVAVGAVHLPVVGADSGDANGFGEVAHGLGRKQPV